MPRCLLSWAPWLALLGATLGAPACSPRDDARPLIVNRWTGMDGEAVVLDHPIEIEFDARLDSGVRLGAVVVRGPDGVLASGFRLDVSGGRLRLHPRLPLGADLEDGSLRPDSEYEVLLRGVPHLAAITSADGAALVGDRLLRFRTLPASAPEALTGYAAPGGYFSLDLPRGGMWLEAAVDESGVVEIGTREPIDPRTLAAPAHLRVWDPERREVVRKPVSLRLVRNAHDGGGVLQCVVPPLARATALELPGTLSAIGGRALVSGDRTLRLPAFP